MSSRILSILAGGFSRRFQDKKNQWLDKFLLQFKEKPLIIHLIEEAKKHFDGLKISVNSSSRAVKYAKIIKEYQIAATLEFIVDLKGISLEGVLRGIYTSLKKSENKYAVAFYAVIGALIVIVLGVYRLPGGWSM